MATPTANRVVRTVIAPSIAFGVVIVVGALLANADVDWSAWRPATCMPVGCFCEGIGSGTVRQQANAWSSLAFVLVSFWAVAVAQYDRASKYAGANAMTRRAVYPVVFAVALVVVGVGSAFYHASLTFAGQFADVFGMYLIGTFVLLYNVGRLRPMSDARAVATYVAINVVLAWALYSLPEVRRYAFAIVVLAALAVERRVRKRGAATSAPRYLSYAVGLLTVAFVVWLLDIRHVLCRPASLWQGHAVWHVLGAVACGCVYLYYRSERAAGIALPCVNGDSWQS